MDCAVQAGHRVHLLDIMAVGVDDQARFADDSSKDGGSDKVIDRCFKLYPWEDMFREPFAEHLAPGVWVEPPWKAVLSNKAMLPLLWERHEGHPNLLACYFADDPRASELERAVSKPFFSREGENVAMLERGETVEEAPGDYGDEPRIVQATADLFASETDEGRGPRGAGLVDRRRPRLRARHARGQVAHHPRPVALRAARDRRVAGSDRAVPAAATAKHASTSFGTFASSSRWNARRSFQELPMPPSQQNLSGSHDGDPDLDALEAEVAEDRAELVGTMEALRSRVVDTADAYQERFSPDAVKAEIGAYASRQGRGMVEAATTRMREHPLETVALAAGAAYPLLRVVSKIPAPVLLLGAGVALAGRGSAKRDVIEHDLHPNRANPNYANPEVTSVDAGGRDVRQPDDGISELDRAKAAARRAATDAGDAVDDAVERVSDTVDRTRAKARRTVAKGYDAAAGAVDAATGTVRAGARRIARTGEEAYESTFEAGQAAGETFVRSVRRNPIAAGAATLVLGGVLAALLPRSRVENRLMGEPADELRRRADVLAARGIDAGRDVVRAAADEAADQGLTPKGAREAIDEAGERVRKFTDDVAKDAERKIEG